MSVPRHCPPTRSVSSNKKDRYNSSNSNKLVVQNEEELSKRSSFGRRRSGLLMSLSFRSQNVGTDSGTAASNGLSQPEQQQPSESIIVDGVPGANGTVKDEVVKVKSQVLLAMSMTGSATRSACGHQKTPLGRKRSGGLHMFQSLRLRTITNHSSTQRLS